MRQLFLSGVGLMLLTTAAAAQPAQPAAPPPPPGERAEGPPPPHRGPPPPPHRGPSPPKGAHFRFEQGDNVMDVKCADDEPMRACADITLQLMDRLASMSPPPPPPPR